MQQVAIVDYGMGNICSVRSALNYLGCDSCYTSDPDQLYRSDKILLPGVGSYKLAMENITSRRLDEVIKKTAAKGVPILGICLGMQILGMSGTEDGCTSGLGLFDGRVDKLGKEDKGALKIPHVGFNAVSVPCRSVLYKGIADKSDFYFVHSFRMTTGVTEGVGLCTYGETFVASFEKDNIFGTQFHPEKSQNNGLTLLANFLQL